MTILGLHHITLITADAQRNVDFYTRVLGLRFIKQTVNFDDPTSYHLYFADETGTPGTVITFFEIPGARQRLRGIGGTHHLALRVADYDGLLKWKRRLTDLGIQVNGPYDRHYFKSIYFKDPDGVILEIATDGPGWDRDEEPDAIGTEFRAPPEEMMVANRDEATIQAITWEAPVDVITADMSLLNGMHHITAISSNIASTHAFYTDILGLRRVKMTDNFDDPGSAHWYWGNRNADVGSTITYFERDPKQTRRAMMGAGLTHHFAFAVEDEDVQREYQKRLTSAGYRVSQILDRDYFKSIYTNDPDGHIVELATAGPGFLIDEDQDNLGMSLQLPDWLEHRREVAEKSLTPLTIDPWQPPQPEADTQ
jgi:glyoxalase family protein